MSLRMQTEFLSMLADRGWQIAQTVMQTIILSALLPNCFANAQVEPDQVSSSLPPPNIIFIFADDLGYGDLGSFGADDVSTPNIDSLAQNGVKFTNFYSASPVCTPSRAGLLTGRYPIRMGIHHVFFPSSYTGMPTEEITIAELLKEVGYTTGIVGKWHLGHHSEFLPLNQGFDEFAGIPYSNDMSPLPFMRGNEFIEAEIDQTQLTRRLTDEATDFIQRNASSPFFLFLSHPMPHVPLYASAEFEGVSQRGTYGDVIEELDWSVGEVLTTLERLDITENTLVVFTSDNGPWLLMEDEAGSSGGLRNGKGTTFEGGMKVPTVARLPGLIPSGLVVDSPASMLDWLPTLVNLAGAEMGSEHVTDGADLSSALKGEAYDAADRVFAYYSHGQLEAIRIGDWKLKRAFDAGALNVPAPVRMVLGDKLGLKPHGPMLFNLREDPAEKNNLYNAHPDKVAELVAALESFEREIGEVPPNITKISLAIDPATNVMISALARAAIFALVILAVVLVSFGFLLGRWRRRRAP